MDRTTRERYGLPDNELNRQYDSWIDTNKGTALLFRAKPAISRPQTGTEYSHPVHGFQVKSEVYKDKKMYVSQDEMARWNVPWIKRDYCAHLFIELEKCSRDHSNIYPFHCQHEAHAHAECVWKEMADREYAAKILKGAQN